MCYFSHPLHAHSYFVGLYPKFRIPSSFPVRECLTGPGIFSFMGLTNLSSFSTEAIMLPISSFLLIFALFAQAEADREKKPNMPPTSIPAMKEIRQRPAAVPARMRHFRFSWFTQVTFFLNIAWHISLWVSFILQVLQLFFSFFSNYFPFLL